MPLFSHSSLIGALWIDGWPVTSHPFANLGAAVATFKLPRIAAKSKSNPPSKTKMVASNPQVCPWPREIDSSARVLPPAAGGLRWKISSVKCVNPSTFSPFFFGNIEFCSTATKISAEGEHLRAERKIVFRRGFHPTRKSILTGPCIPFSRARQPPYGKSMRWNSIALSPGDQLFFKKYANGQWTMILVQTSESIKTDSGPSGYQKSQLISTTQLLIMFRRSIYVHNSLSSLPVEKKLIQRFLFLSPCRKCFIGPI